MARPDSEKRDSDKRNLASFLGMPLEQLDNAATSGGRTAFGATPATEFPDEATGEDGLHPATVLTRRVFFVTLAKMMAVTSAVALGGAAVARAMDVAGAIIPGDQLQSLPPADRWVMVIDLAACDGCRQCMRACKTGHFLPEDDHHWMDVWKEEGPAGAYFRPRPCMQCDNPPCVAVCPVGATYHNQNGIVLVDNQRCIGCRACMVACPYDARYFWWGKPENPSHLSEADYTPELTMPHRQGTVSKCVFCADYLHQSRLPRCVQQCPRNALWFGERTTDIVTNGVEVRKLDQFLAERGAYRYKEEKGTLPKVYYLPPRYTGTVLETDARGKDAAQYHAAQYNGSASFEQMRMKKEV